MNKKIILTVLVILLVSVAGGLYFLKAKTTSQKVYHVGMLSGVPIFNPIVDSFKASMTKLGYVDGTSIVYDVQKTNPDPTVYQNVLRKFVSDKDDLIVVVPTEPALIAKDLSQGTIPIIFAADFEGVTLIDSVQRPGNNITGVRIGGVDSAVERIKLMSEIVPHAQVYAPYDKNYPISQATMSALRAAAAPVGLTLEELPVASVDEIINDITKREASGDIGVDAVIIMPSPLMTIPPAWPALQQFAQRHKLPIAGGFGDAIREGALFAVLPNPDEQGNIMAGQADKIFHGVPAGTIPVSTPNLRLIVNYKVAQLLGLTLNENFLSKADEIFR